MTDPLFCDMVYSSCLLPRLEKNGCVVRSVFLEKKIRMG